MKAFYSRWQKQSVKHALETRRIVMLAGARQCGKTTLAKEICSEDTLYLTLDDAGLRESAENDPNSFVKHTSRTLIIDEIQLVPSLILALKKAVDEDTRPGQFLITGSANLQSLPTVKESLAGRLTKIRLRPLSQGEIRTATPSFLTYAFNQTFEYKSDLVSRDQLIDIALKGGYPEALLLENRDRRKWFRDYINTLLERDLKDIANIQNINIMRALVKVLSSWSSKFMDISQIASGMAVGRPTISSYINALETLYLVERVYPWIKTDYARVGKQDKIFMTDSGLMAGFLGWKPDQVKYDSDRLGKLIETFAFNELATIIDVQDGEYELYHYRDREKREIDFIIEREDGALLAIEIKASSVVYKKNFQHIEWFQQNVAKDRPCIGIVLYSGEHVLPFGPNKWAVPFGLLWPKT
jgi:hypothetical protein